VGSFGYKDTIKEIQPTGHIVQIGLQNQYVTMRENAAWMWETMSSYINLAGKNLGK
jgi:hypothetical protein